MQLSPRLLRPAAAVLAAASASVLAACGGSGGGDPSADPAAIVPARAAVYVEANFKPGDDVNELAKKLSGEDDPGGAIKRAIEKQARETDKDFSFSEDVEPWLGDRAGLFLPRVSAGDEQQVAIVLPTKDADKAKDFFESELREESKGESKPVIVERNYRDTDYLLDTSDDSGVVMIDDYAVFGSDAGIKGALDAREGESLAESSEYGKARDGVEEDRVGFMYVRLSQVFSSLGAQGAAARQAFGGLGETIAVGLDGDANAIRTSFAALGLTGAAGEAAGPGEVLPTLPASAWLAAGVSDVGTRLEKTIEQFSQLGALGGANPEELLEQFEREVGIDPRRDLAAWMGDVGFFAFGDTPAEFGAGLVATTKDAGAARRALPRLTRFVRTFAVGVKSRPLSRGGIDTGVTFSGGQLPLPVHMALTDDDRFILALTDGALSQALQDTDRLGESQAFTNAARSLGTELKPMLFMNFEPLRGFVDSTGAGSNPNVQKASEGLDRLTSLVAGSKREGDASRGRVVVGVK